jgi:ABC-type transport system involved in multi-copper enzyme maturation permease subunit
MAAPQAPSFAAAVATTIKLSLVRFVRGRKLRLALLATGLVVIAAVSARYAAGEASADAGAGIEPEELVQAAVRLGFFDLLCYLVPYLFAAGAISEEAESRTLPYLLMRPIGRTAMTIGKWLAASVTSCVVLGLGVLLVHVGAWATDPGHMIDEIGPTLEIVGALCLLSFLYSALCLFFGALVIEAGGLLSIVYMAFMEFFVGSLPVAARAGSMNYLATQLAGLPKGGLLPEYAPDVETWICGLVIGVMTLVFLGLATLVTNTSELGFGKA